MRKAAVIAVLALSVAGCGREVSDADIEADGAVKHQAGGAAGRY